MKIIGFQCEKSEKFSWSCGIFHPSSFIVILIGSASSVTQICVELTENLIVLRTFLYVNNIFFCLQILFKILEGSHQTQQTASG